MKHPRLLSLLLCLVIPFALTTSGTGCSSDPAPNDGTNDDDDDDEDTDGGTSKDGSSEGGTKLTEADLPPNDNVKITDCKRTFKDPGNVVCGVTKRGSSGAPRVFQGTILRPRRSASQRRGHDRWQRSHHLCGV